MSSNRGNYSAASSLFPATGGSGSAGAILSGDIWYISVSGTLGGVYCEIGASIRALSNAPGQTSTNWSINHPQKARILLRRDTAANWTSANPVLGLGEIGIEQESGKPTKIKLGDGVTAWSALINVLNTAPVHTFSNHTDDYILALTDVCNTDNNLPIVTMNKSTANLLTVPANADVAFSIGSVIKAIQTGVGQTTITPDVGVTVHGTPGLNFRDQYSFIELIKFATDSWYARGDLSA
jgi:hypothetical protein